MRALTQALQRFKNPSIRQSPARQSPVIEVNDSPIHGAGVFAKKDCRPGSVIELAPLILLSQTDRDLLQHTALFGYYFVINHSNPDPNPDLDPDSDPNPDYAIAMGLGASSLYNHSPEANAAYSISIEDQVITIRDHRPIRKGEEITLNYNGSPDDPNPVYFPPSPSSLSSPQSPPPSPPSPPPASQSPPPQSPRPSPPPDLYLRDLPLKGRGVFCTRPIPAGTLIETSILLVLPAPDYPPISHTRNHALYPNATYEIDHANRLIRYYAREDISDTTEICINYDGAEGSEGSEEWFKTRNIHCSH